MSFDFIVPACNAETLLVTKLGFPTENHQNGDGQVINILDNTKRIPSDQILIGIMDKPVGGSPSHIPDLYTDIDTVPYGISIKKRKNSNRYIIYINEVFEKWIQKIGKVKNIPRPFPKDDAKFISEMKRGTDRKIVSYIEKITQSNVPTFNKIKKWIQNLDKQRKDV
jgi:hypothetical protein